MLFFSFVLYNNQCAIHNNIGDIMNTNSVWEKSTEIPKHKTLTKDIKADVCVIGGGMAGLLIAYKLQEKGFDTVVLEAKRIGRGQTKNTTAKITAQHGLKYTNLVNHFGETKAEQYAKANLFAIDEYEKIIKMNNIDCDFCRLPSYLYSLEENNNLIEEYENASKLGIDCYLTDKTGLPFKVRQALVFTRQAQFNPLNFLKVIAEKLNIFENSMVIDVNKNVVKTEKACVEAKHIVFATHYPIVNTRGMYFARMHQSRAYGIAVEGGKSLEGIYYSEDEGGLSLRNYKNYTIIVGEGHITGDNKKGDKFFRLRQRIQQMFPESIEIAHWSAQDTMPIDGVPYIGKYCITTPDWYVATGFGKWGMSSSMVSAMIISDMISGKDNPYSKVFAPARFKSSSADNLCKMGGKAIKGISKEFFSVPKEKFDDIKRGQAGIIQYNGEKVGVYKDHNDNIYMVDVMCTHMGCQLEWNGDEKCWECPCHGSRFSYMGELIDNPAQRHLNNISEKEKITV